MVELFDLHTQKNIDIYNQLLTRFGNKYPYYSIPFYLYFSNGLTKLYFVRYQEGDNCFLLPLYINEIDNFPGKFEAYSPYGYSGPLITENTNNEVLKNIWKEVESLLISKDVISCFIRFSLDSRLEYFPGKIVSTMNNIRGMIYPSESDQFQNFEHKVRKNYRKAVSNNLKFFIKTSKEITEKDLENFIDVYYATMQRNEASNSFYFSKDVFNKYFNSAKDDYIIASVLDDNGKQISVELILVSNDTLYSFLGGTLDDYYPMRPNDFLKVNVINWGRDNCYKYYTLGGGYGSDDGIYNYKKSFFPNCILNYYTGRWILNQNSYEKILNFFMNRYICKFGNDDLSEIDFFPEYKKYQNKLL